MLQVCGLVTRGSITSSRAEHLATSTMALLGFISMPDILHVLGYVITLLFALAWARTFVASIRIKKAGGIRAPNKTTTILSGPALYWDVGKHQRRNQLPEWCTKTIDAAVPPNSNNRHCAEFSFSGQKRVLLTRDPDQIKTILATKFADFGHGPQWHALWRPFLGDGIFAVDGAEWQASRAMIRPMFVRERVRDLGIFERCTEKLLGKMPGSGEGFDVKELLYRWTLDTTTDFLLGECVNSLDNPQNEFAEALNTAQRIQMFIFVLNPIAPLIPKGAYLRAIAQMEKFIDPIIARALALPSSELEDLSQSDDSFTFLHSIVQHSRDPKLLRDQIMSVLLAGRDTTAATLSWALHEMAGRPKTWRRLRTEVLSAMGDRGSARPTYETLKDVRYLKHILDETLRLHPAVPLNMRQALKTTSVPGPVPGGPDIILLKGDTVTIHAIGMHNRADLCVPPASEKKKKSVEFADPAVFSPERWEEWTPTPWTYAPFHGGPRICVGQNFALTEMAYLLARLAQKYERIEARGDRESQYLKAEIIGTPALPVEVAFYEEES